MEKLKSEDPNINVLGKPITVVQESLITSLHALGIGIGPILFGKIPDLIGRKKSVIIFGIFEALGFAILSIGSNLYCYYTARCMQGFCLGFLMTGIPMYLSEIAEDCNRGRSVTFVNIFAVLGNIYGYTMSWLLGTRTFNLVCTIPLIIHITFFIFFLPETPIYLIKIGNFEAAKNSLKKLRNISFAETEKEISHLELTVAQKTSTQKYCNLWKIKKPLLICCGLFTLQHFSGYFVILGYLESVLSSANLPLPSDICSVLVGCFELIPVLVSSVLVEKLGRKYLLLLSSGMIFVSLFFLGAYFHIKLANIFNISNISWIPLVIIPIIMMGYGIGIGPTTLVIMGEIFPMELKTTGASVSVFLCGIVNFAVIFTFPLAREYLGLASCFWIFGALSSLGFIFIYFFVPETKGKSFSEIQKMMKNK